MSDKAPEGLPADLQVLRCQSCNKLVHHKTIHALGRCMECGNRRMVTVHTLSEEEMDKLKTKEGVDEFLALFEQAVEEVNCEPI